MIGNDATVLRKIQPNWDLCFHRTFKSHKIVGKISSDYRNMIILAIVP